MSTKRLDGSIVGNTPRMCECSLLCTGYTITHLTNCACLRSLKCITPVCGTAPSQYGRPTASYAPSKPVANTPSMASTAAPSNADYSKGVCHPPECARGHGGLTRVHCISDFRRRGCKSRGGRTAATTTTVRRPQIRMS